MGTEVGGGTKITFTISKGPDPSSIAEPSPEPSQEPSPSASTPPSGEETPPAVPVYRTIQVKLPDDGRESVTVRIQVGDDAAAYDNVVDTNLGTIPASVKGIGVQQVTIYIDEVAVESYPLDFSE